MSEKQETEVTEEEAFDVEMKRLSGVDVEEAPVQKEAEEVEAGSEVTEEAETEETKPEGNNDEASVEPDDLTVQLNNLRQQNEKLQKALDKTNGTYGSQLANLQQQIQSLTQQRRDAADEVKKQISPAKLNKLREGGFDELADLLESDLSNAIVAPEMPDIDGMKSELQRQLDEERQARDEEIRGRELRLLKREHPDFEDVAGFGVEANGMIQWNDAKFGNWVASQPKEKQDEIINGNDAYVLSDYIAEYKETLKQAQKKPNNLKKAIQPKGVPAGRTSVLDEEDQAFRDEIKRLMENV